MENGKPKILRSRLGVHSQHPADNPGCDQVPRSHGDLIGIEQVYVQNGQQIHHLNQAALGNKNLETDVTCAAPKVVFEDRNRFAEMGGMKLMGEALDHGMVLVISMWDDIAVSMNRLDSDMGVVSSGAAPGALRGPCNHAEGKPEILREAHPGGKA